MLNNFTDLAALQADLLAQKITMSQVVAHYLHNIKATAHLNAFIEVYEAEILENAAILDKKIQTQPKQLGALFGAVVSLKDLFCYENHEVTAASRILKGFTAPYSATAVQRIIDADALIIGRVNCDEFGMGSGNENSAYGAVRNPHDTARVAGGSSGGSAAAVAADTCLASLGSDTGGSVRQPAAWCGVFGFKPTYGRISRWGLLAYASSFDTVGILAKNGATISAILSVIQGTDGLDATVVHDVFHHFNKNIFNNDENDEKHNNIVNNNNDNIYNNKKNKIAIFKNVLNNNSIDKEINLALQSKIKELEEQGFLVEEVDFPLLDYIIPTYYVLTTAEASTNLARYDGVRFGQRAIDTQNLYETYARSRTEGFGTEVKRRILLGTFVLSAGFYDAYYGKAQRVRRKIQDATNAILDEYDFILCPATPQKPFCIGEQTDDPVANYLADIFTVQANLCGMPAISFPIGQHSDGLPIGAQLLGKRFDDEALLNVFQ